MRGLTVPLMVCLTAGFSLISCTEDEPTKPTQEEFAGILVADVSCTILGGDTTDFLPRPIRDPEEFPRNHSLIIVCPNPVIGDTTFIRFQIPETDSVTIQAFASPNVGPVTEILSDRLPAGVFAIKWGFSGPNGVYRIRMTTERGFSSYGDVQFEWMGALTRPAIGGTGLVLLRRTASGFPPRKTGRVP